MKDVFSGYKPTIVQFLRELEKNNNRNWFNKNKQRYENEVLFPSLDFISAVGERLPSVSENFTAIPKRMGGSIMRIYRDTRFSKDKTPYKTNVGIQFRHRLAKDVHSPGYYIHIAPDECFVGVGTWRPPSDALFKIRKHIVENPKKWIAVRDSKTLNAEYELIGEKLKSAPRGFNKEHELIEDLKRKDFIVSKNIDEKVIEKDSFVDDTIKLFKSAEPLMKFLCDALVVPY